jgi:hypothetical protein
MQAVQYSNLSAVNEALNELFIEEMRAGKERMTPSAPLHMY